MSEPLYKVGKAIKIVYQAAGAATGKTIEMAVYDEAQVLSADFPTGQSIPAMTEIGATGRYREEFTPDVEGDWMVQIRDSVADSGKVVKHYQIGGDDIDSVGDTAGLIKVQTDLLPGDPASQTSVDASIAGSESALDAAITASQAVVVAEIDDLESPAMVG